MLWRDANPALLRYLRVIAAEAAEDIAADTWVQMVRSLDAFRGDEAAWRAWLFTTARRRAIDEGRRRSRRPVVSVPELPDVAGPDSVDPADLVLEKLGTEAAISIISSLPRFQAEVITLRVVAGLDNQAVAQLVGRSPGAVRVAAHRRPVRRRARQAAARLAARASTARASTAPARGSRASRVPRAGLPRLSPPGSRRRGRAPARRLARPRRRRPRQALTGLRPSPTSHVRT